VSARTGILLLVSGPSGSGKTTLCRRLADEKEAHDYHFLSREDFNTRIKAGEVLEHAEVHGNHYGTLKSEVLDYIQKGVDVVMDIDVQGATLVRDCNDAEIKEALVDLFVMNGSG